MLAGWKKHRTRLTVEDLNDHLNARKAEPSHSSVAVGCIIGKIGDYYKGKSKVPVLN
jgi:hypothetical protein